MIKGDPRHGTRRGKGSDANVEETAKHLRAAELRRQQEEAAIKASEQQASDNARAELERRRGQQ